MAGYHRYTAVLDACVLYPVALRDLLLTLSTEGVYGARWTDQIQEEWVRNLLANRPELSVAALARTTSMMNEAIDDCRITNYEYLVESLTLPDPNDRHVLAAAIVGHADAIVTFNLKDFPEAIAIAHNLEILHPDDFIIAQYDLDHISVLSAVKACRLRLKNPPVSAEDKIAALERQGLPQTCKLLRSAIDLI
jgi:predicted nucleic acid-binding protein